MGVPIRTILERKGRDVATIEPDQTLARAVERLAEAGIGALVVSSDGRTVEGIVSERDVVRQLARVGPSCLDAPVSDAMAREVLTSSPGTTTDQIMSTMTEERVRHLPVLEDGALAGIVSIGDIVKWRLDELATETEQLGAYVSGSY